MSTDKKIETSKASLLKVRMTLTSRNVKNLEKVSAMLIEAAKSKHVQVRGPVRMPTKVLRITTRKTPCGEGSKTWDRFQMRIHKRVIDIVSTIEDFKQITNINMEAGVEIEVTTTPYVAKEVAAPVEEKKN